MLLFQPPGANHHSLDTRGHKTHPVSLYSLVWGSGILSRGPAWAGHPLECLGWCGLLPSMVAAGHCPSQEPGTSAGVHGQAQDARQSRLQRRQRDLCGRDTPALLPQDRCVPDTLGVRPAERMGLWQAADTPGSGPPCSQGRTYPHGARPTPTLAGIPLCPVPRQASVRSRASGLG